METIHWTLAADAPPLLIRKCPKCGNERYETGGRFRVNANGRRLDVWLVYRCTACRNTWNLSVCERVDRKSIDSARYDAFQLNDALLVRRLGFDSAFLGRNRAILDADSLRWRAEGPDVPEGRAARVVVSCPFELPLPVGRVIAETLGVSVSRLKKLSERGMLSFDGDLKKRRASRGFAFELREGWSRGG